MQTPHWIRAWEATVSCLCGLGLTVAAARGQGLPAFDFTQPTDRQGWQATHDVASLTGSAEGMVVQISGPDPYITGPARDYPAGRPLWLRLRLKSDQGGTGQVFYFTSAPTEEMSVRFPVAAGDWATVQVPLVALGPGYRLRIDPPGSGGTCLLGQLWFEERVLFAPPAWPMPVPPVLAAGDPFVESGRVRLRHNRTELGGFGIEVGGQPVAVGNPRALLGYVLAGEARWVSLAAGSIPAPQVSVTPTGLVVRATAQDPHGAGWVIEQRFSPGSPGTIETETLITTDQDREVLYLPLITLLPGVGSHGTNKHQALFAGVEYLENEPSSSEADVEGPGAWRLAPDTIKQTFPLMALEEGGRYVGLLWQPQTRVCAVFDSPDRQFRSGGHLMGLIFPGSDGVNREERSLLPYRAERLSRDVPFRLRATLIGGTGSSVVPAVQAYVRIRGLPDVPDPGLTSDAYFALAAHGWLDSRIRETHLFRHAYWPGFNAQPAADAALWMAWLSTRVTDPGLAARLTNAAAGALSQVAVQNYNASQIGHVRFPLPALVFGPVLENAVQAEASGQSLLGRFQADGSVYYEPRAGGLDYGRTHWAREANGLTAGVVVALLEAAAFSGDPGLIDAGLRHLRSMEKFRDTVPRGAQTWEIPLHTPDILASAHLVRAYTLGYELSGNTNLLDRARDWAWTGVPFVYLHPPTPAPVGLYNTIAVLGATSWQAPLWIGLPVQWCGLVYAQALDGLARHDPSGPWRQLADGISAAGIQHTWLASDGDRQGLLPDSYQLRAQLRDGPAINPATVQVPALQLFRQTRPYDFRCLLRHGLRVHAPGEVSEVVERADGVSFRVRTWSPGPSRVLVNGLGRTPQLRINGQPVPLSSPHQFHSSEGRLVIVLTDPALVELLHPAVLGVRVRWVNPRISADLAWPAAASNSVLESVSTFGGSPRWSEVNLPRRQEAGEWITTAPLDAATRFFRLRQVP